MQSLPDTFCVFILTHGRPDNVITLKTLKRCGYTGRLYLIIDNEDETADQYIKNFGADRVIMFDKKAEADLCDRANNFDEMRTVLMSRNACFRIAENLGVTHFVELDDDYTAFQFRYNKSLSGRWKIKNLDKVFLSFLGFYQSAPIKSVALCQGGDHIGGFSGVTELKRKCMNSFFCSPERPFRFVGAMNDDVNTYVTLGVRGEMFFTFTSAQLVQIQTQAQSRGLTDMYLLYGTYCKSFTTVMMAPSSVKVGIMSTKHSRIHHSINWKCTVPCILREQHKKC